MRITLAQVDSRLGDVDANLEQAERVIARAVGDSTDLVVFPELYLTGYSVGMIDADLALGADDPRLLRLAALAGKAGVLMGFMEAPLRGPHTYNSAAYYTGGELVHVHRKLYLPTYASFEERKHFTPGPNLRAFSAAGTQMATLICNDAWQPQLAFLATQEGAGILLVPANSAQSLFPEHYDSSDYWHSITRFYGRMFQLYVVFVNRVGTEGDLRFWGGSHVVDPWGNVLGQAVEGAEDLVTVDVDLAEIRRRRRSIPLVKEARLGLLQREVTRLLEEGGDI
jgi:predicted amidohydrolase